jgi:outer membrane immunogenic protein
MKFSLLAGVGIAAIMVAGSAFAADMPMKAAPMAYAPYDWSGVYIGGVIGGQWSRTDSSNFDPIGAIAGVPGSILGAPAFQTTDASSFIGGVEGGERYQFGKLVIGWEADMVWGNANATSATSFGQILVPPGSITNTITVNNKWTGTATSSVGIAHDRWLVYGKAGVAWTKNDYTASTTVAGATLFTGTGSDSDTRVGWTVGTGVEWAIWNSWSVKVEYDYLDFGTKTVGINGSFIGAVGASLPMDNNQHINQVKAGLNWHFMPNFW